jgi:hypothetical protein
MNKQFEEFLCEEYCKAAKDEVPISEWLAVGCLPSVLIVIEGFEDRALGILRFLSLKRCKVKSVILGRYSREETENAANRTEFEQLCGAISVNPVSIRKVDDSGDWVSKIVSEARGESIFIDISGASNAHIFNVINAAASGSGDVQIGYTDAKIYWPTHKDWKELKKSVTASQEITKKADIAPWLFGTEHSVRVLRNHEGFDDVGSEKALVAFLPFKAARLQALIGDDEYVDYMFLCPRPRMGENKWRVKACQEANSAVIGTSPVFEVNAFGYKNTVLELMNLLFRETGLILRSNIHMAPLGSKIQTVGSWVFCVLVPSITVKVSSPKFHFAKAYSSGTGASFVIPLLKPLKFREELLETIKASYK